MSAHSIRQRLYVAEDGCWMWIGRTTQNGYGLSRRRVDGKKRTIMAHRHAYEVFVGPIPEGLHLDHLCRTPLCVNPGHLEPVSPQENNRRSDSPSARNARATHCVQGHEFSQGNTRVRPNGERSCRRCSADLVRQAYWRRKGVDEAPPLKGISDCCPQGHLYDEANTARNRKGHRLCRACAAARQRKKYWAKKQRRASGHLLLAVTSAAGFTTALLAGGVL
jgi:hypothetical protein